MKREETVRWHERELTLQPDGLRRHGQTLCEGGRTLATMTRAQGQALARGEHRRDDPPTDPGLLLFMAFIVQAYSDDASFDATPPGS